jgi:hypothetical protein
VATNVLSSSRAGVASAVLATTTVGGTFQIAGVGTVRIPIVSFSAGLWATSAAAATPLSISISLHAMLRATSAGTVATPSISDRLNAALQATSAAAALPLSISLSFRTVLRATSDGNASLAVILPSGNNLLSASRAGIVSAVWTKTVSGAFHIVGIGTVQTPGTLPVVANLRATLGATSRGAAASTVISAPISLAGRIGASSRASGALPRVASLAARITAQSNAAIVYVPASGRVLTGWMSTTSRGAASIVVTAAIGQQDAVSIITG